MLIGYTSTSTCPVKAMQKFLSICQRQPPGPLFVLQSGKNVTRRLVSEMTQSLLRSAGLDWQCYSSHSYRIGAQHQQAFQIILSRHWVVGIVTLTRTTYGRHQKYSVGQQLRCTKVPPVNMGITWGWKLPLNSYSSSSMSLCH